MERVLADGLFVLNTIVDANVNSFLLLILLNLLMFGTID